MISIIIFGFDNARILCSQQVEFSVSEFSLLAEIDFQLGCNESNSGYDSTFAKRVENFWNK